MSNNAKRRYNNIKNNKKKNNKKKNKRNSANNVTLNEKNKEVTVDINDSKEIDKAIDKLFQKDIVLDTDDKIRNDLEENDLIPPENNLIEHAIVNKEIENDNSDIIDIPFIEEANNIDAIESDVSESKDEQEKGVIDENDLLEDKVNNMVSLKIDEPEEYKNDIINNEINDQEKIYVADKIKNNKGGKYVGYSARLLINIVGIILFIILSGILLIASISIKARSNILYKQTSDLDYKVYLKENDYYKEPYLNKNMQYIASLIDYVDVNFNYNFSVNQNINYKYTYYVKADVSVTDTQDKTKVIYSKTDRLTEPETIVKDNSVGFYINQNVKINYAKYNDLIKAFKSSYSLNADGNLVLSLCVEIEDEKGNKIRSLDSNDTMKIIIPLTEQMIDITMDYKEINNSNNVSVYKDFSISNKVTFILSVISLLISIVFLIRLFIFIKKTTIKKTVYDITLSKILREYDRVIVNSKKIVDLNDDIVDVNSFNELLDVRDNLEKPIIFSEIHKGQKSIFIVKTPNETYRYILKLVDLQKEHENEKKM